MKALIALVVTAATLLCDGGGVIAQRDVKPWRITLWSNPSPPRSGPVEIAVLVQEQGTLEPVLDAGVQVTLRSPQGSDTSLPAIRSRTGNRLFYSVRATLQAAGQWQIVTVVKKRQLRVEVPAKVVVVSPDSATDFIPLVALVPAGLAMLTLSRLLSSRPPATSHLHR